MSSMRQRHHIDEEASPERAPAPLSASKRKKKKNRGNTKRVMVFLLAGTACVTISVLWLASKTSTPPLRLPLRRSLFVSEIGVSTKCQKALRLNRATLDTSLALGTTFLLNHQKEGGNFDYEFDWISLENSNDDSDVRQAGALWGMALIFHDMCDSLLRQSDLEEATRVLTHVAKRILKGIHFFETNSKILKNEQDDTQVMRYLTYPTEDEYGTGTQALVCLALVDFLRALNTSEEALALAGISNEEFEHIYTLLDELLPFLVTQHSQALVTYKSRFQAYNALRQDAMDVLTSGLWFGTDPTKMKTWWQQHEGPWLFGYFYDTFDQYGNRKGDSSPYYDGESLLAITKAAKYLGNRYIHLWPMAAGTAQALHKTHVEEALEEDEDSNDTKGAYQWLSMTLFELATVTFGEGYKEPFDLPYAISDTYPQNQFGTWLVEMALWMIDVHETLRKGRNTGYAYEGIVPAWAWISHVVSQNDNDAHLAKTARKLECTIEEGMSKLMSWQVGMGAEKQAESLWNGIDGLGGVQNAKDESGLRIDVTQHQMHATILTRRLVYPPLGDESWPWSQVDISGSKAL
jgi:hypothetical protein